MTDSRKIIHIDMDAYYAAVEQRDHPEYRGKPVVVGGSPNSRAVVCTSSYEARKFGIKSAMPCSQAYRLCPSAIFVAPRFSAYKKVTHEIHQIFYEYTDLVEPLSLDEAFLDVTHNKKGMASATHIAQEILARIKNDLGLSASAGVSAQKFLAKIASDFKKPGGLTVIPPQQVAVFVDALPIGKFFGVGKVTEQKMFGLGIKTGKDLKNFPLEQLKQYFGKSALFYYEMAHGIDRREVVAHWERKSLSAETTFREDTRDVTTLTAYLKEVALEVQQRLKKSNLQGRTITLKVRYSNFARVTRSITLPQLTDDADILFLHAQKMLVTTDVVNLGARLIGVGVSGFTAEPPKILKPKSNQLPLPGFDA
jgi:DNA polymerase-4